MSHADIAASDLWGNSSRAPVECRRRRSEQSMPQREGSFELMLFSMPPLIRLAASVWAASLALPPSTFAQDVYVNAQVPWHNVVLDAQGKLLAWYQPEKNLGYDHVIRLGWDFI